MRQSLLFTKTQNFDPKDEESLNAKLLLRAGFVYKVTAGVYSYLPLGLLALKKIEEIIRKRMSEVGSLEILMSSLQPPSLWEKTGRYDSLDVLFRFNSFYSKNDYVLGPTHEELVTPILKNNIFSYKDLPVSVFQLQWKFRDEKRAKSGLMRGREFYMKDAYSFHADEKDLDLYYEKIIGVYKNIFNDLGIGENTYLTYASGGTFSKYSHEFQMLTEAGEDIIYLCSNCRVAVNQEIYGEQNTCPVCASPNLLEKKATEVGNIFKLGNKFSLAFDFSFKDVNGEAKNPIMGCYGIGVSRLLGAIVEANNDEKGMILNKAIAPYQFHLIESRAGLGLELYEKMKQDGLSVLYDDREISLGSKFADADLIGLPYRLVVSDKTEGKIELKKREEKNIQLIDYEILRTI